MANSTIHSGNGTTRGEASEPEITAQPRPLADEFALQASAEPDLSIDADDLGARFLSEAVEQGDFDPERRGFEELSLVEGPATDAAHVSSNAFPNDTLWERTINVSVRSAGDANQLFGPGDLSSDPLIDPLDEDDDPDTGEVRVDQSSVRDASLFDREGEEGDDTISPDIDSDDQGRHARVSSRGEYGEQVDAAPPRESYFRQRAAGPEAQTGGTVETVLRKAASSLRRLAGRLR